jgi:hypothetical protein
VIRWPAALVAGLIALPAAPVAAQSFDPAYRFQRLDTPHFAIHFHQGEAPAATRLALIAEETWLALHTALAATPPRHTDVILVDQTEAASGWATPAPRDTVMVSAAWPDGVEFIGATDDWLRLVFTHEFTHIAHLDRSKGWAAAVRAVFGRVPLAFPNTLLPVWQIEGLATFEESAILHEGRLYAGDFRAIVDEAARARRPEPVDRVNGGLTDWPAGLAPYAYGLAFHAYLAERFGEATFGRLAEATAGAIPYLWSRQFEEVYGSSLGSLWLAFEETLQAAETPSAARARRTAAEADAPVRLTHDGFVVTAPRIAPPSCPTCGARVVYAARNADEFPGLFEAPLDAAAPPRRLTDRYLGTSTGVSRDRLYFDQQDLRRNAGLYSDLYVLDRATSGVRRLTHDARLIDPDLSPDGRRLVAVENRAGHRALVTLVADTGAAPATPGLDVLAESADTQFNGPRWSPDGRTVVAERHRLGTHPDIVLIDVATHDVRVLVATTGVRWVTPTWRPDGRAVVAAADLGGGPFNLYEIEIDRPRVRQLTHLTGGATWPDVSPDGQTLVFAGYTVDGFDVFRAPYRAADDRTDEVMGTPRPDMPRDAVSSSGPSPDVTRPYTPWPTLAPTSWAPVWDISNQRTRAGARVSGTDVLGYHTYTLMAAWVVSQPAGTPTAESARPDVDASYAYTRWVVSPWVTASRETSFFGVAPADGRTPTAATVHERQIETGVSLPLLHVRQAQSLRVSFVRAVEDIEVDGQIFSSERAALRATWALQTAHTFGYSISPERGLAVGATAEFVQQALGADADARVLTTDARLYLPGAGRHHVVALRLGGGASTGSPDTGRIFLLGGSAAAPGVANLGSEAFSLLRGFAPDSFAGRRAVVANLDYRLPLWRPERGHGILPLFLHTLHAAVFADAGHAWTREFSARDIKVDAGAELSADVVLGYWLPLTTTAGAAWGHDGSGLVPDGWRLYARIGHAF